MLTERAQHDIHELKGLWWLPSDESDNRAGTLMIDHGSVALELLGDFGHQMLTETGRQKTFSLDLAEQPRILGLSTDGTPITLEGDQGAPHETHLPGMTVATYRRKAALIGKHFGPDEEISFDEISVELSDVNEWTRVTGFTGSRNFEELAEGGYASIGIDLHYEAPDDIEIELARGEMLTLRFRASSKGLGRGDTRFSISQKTAVRLRFARPTEIERCFTRVHQLRNFLSLAVGRPVSVLSVTAFCDDHVREQSNELVPIQVLWEVARNPEPPERPRDAHKMLFTYPDIAEQASDVMQHWFAKQRRLQPVFDLFFGVRHLSDLPLEVRFLTTAQAIDTYDFRRRRHPGNFSLAQRLEGVCDQCKSVAQKLIGSGDDDRDEFVRTFRDTRNWYTHYNPRHEKKAAQGAALFVLLTQLQSLIEMSLLRQLGFGCRQVDEILERTRRYAEIRHFQAIEAEEAGGSGA
jgi:hypothetical protein